MTGAALVRLTRRAYRGRAATGVVSEGCLEGYASPGSCALLAH
ncbi:hypothetical protein HMPREF1129_2753 [Actinomyces naeslundii str. Howell 279]|uniref:Uncharacterized protein n=1 Tax=Actinomyces naeslundii (strain ATCC 12104 / DSM 43013 / CCUG 2238 / JCM 8349 / NCTC 10301 / Howell 279) TaxID=1115803 RepID=J2ZSX2_ACTNH|nr:hypothetical protein HMPREF1129_2753 [Actinomyces naeslundii str. Howell 279]